MEHQDNSFEKAKTIEKSTYKLVKIKTSKFGIVAIVLGITGLFFMGAALGGAAIVSGIFALRNSNENKVIAILGILIGTFDLISVMLLVGSM